MLNFFKFAIIMSLLQVRSVRSDKILSCKLAILPFNDLKCLSEKPYFISPTAVTYLVKVNESTFQLKVKPLSEEEKEVYQNLKEEKEEENVSNSKKVVLDEDSKEEIEKEIVTREKDEINQKIVNETDTKENQQNQVNLEVDNKINHDARVELKQIKEKTAFDSDTDKQLEENLKMEATEQQEIQEAKFVNNPYLILQIPKSIVVKLNEAKVLMSLNKQRYFQTIKNERIFAGFQIMLLEHFENGSLRDFLLEDSEKPESERFFRTEISKMKFMEKLTMAVVDLHRQGFIHANLSPDTVYLNEEMDPVIGNFEYVHQDDSISQFDSSFFATDGEFVFTTDLKNLKMEKIVDIQNGDSEGNNISKIETTIVEKKKPATEQTTHNPQPELQIKLKFTRSLEFLAPELIIPESNRTFYFNQKMDTYSLGAIYYFMLYGRPPFEGRTREELINHLGTRFVVVFRGTSNNSVSILGNSLGLVPDARTSTYFLGLLITRELSRNFDHKLMQDLKISTDFEYTNKYGRDFFDKYSEMIFVLVMAFLVIPLTVFLASYKFKYDNHEQVERPNPRINEPPINMEQAPDANVPRI